MKFQDVIEFYIVRGYYDCNAASARRGDIVPSYLLLTSGDMSVPSHTEVRVTTRCYRPFIGTKMVVVASSSCFDLIDLKVGHRSQFARPSRVPLRDWSALIMGAPQEVRPEPIRWPLDTCSVGSEVSVTAVIPEGSVHTKFEVLLLGKTVL